MIISIPGGMETLNEYNRPTYDDVLQFDAVAHQWRRIGSMKMSRYNHAMSVINYNEVADYCH